MLTNADTYSNDDDDDGDDVYMDHSDYEKADVNESRQLFSSSHRVKSTI